MTEQEEFVAVLKRLGVSHAEIRRNISSTHIDVGQTYFKFDSNGRFLGFEVDDGMGHDPFEPRI